MLRIWIGRIGGLLLGGAMLGTGGPAAALPGQVVSRASVASDGTQANAVSDSDNITPLRSWLARTHARWETS